MKVKLKLICNVMLCNGSMHMDMYDRDRCVFSGKDLEQGVMMIDVEIDWPTNIHILLSNKNPEDTQIDDQGKVIADKAIEVQQVLINNFPVHQDLIDKIFVCSKQDSSEYTNENWWGFNGVVQINLNEPNPMRYMLSMSNEFDMNRLDWNQNVQ